MHERGLAGAVVTNQPQAFAAAHPEAHSIERADGAEILFDAVQSDCRFVQVLLAADDLGRILGRYSNWRRRLFRSS